MTALAPQTLPILRGPRFFEWEKADPSPSDRRQSRTILTLILGALDSAPQRFALEVS